MQGFSFFPAQVNIGNPVMAELDIPEGFIVRFCQGMRSIEGEGEPGFIIDVFD